MRHYVIIDLEATCWGPGDPETGINEIIEIGVVVLSPEKTELWRASHFVRPKLNPVLSEFCKELTTIEQHQVDSAETFPVVMNRLEDELRSVLGSPVADSLFVSWGNYDRRQFEKDCALHGYQYPFGEHFNLKEEFTRRHKVRRSGLKTALGVMRLPLLGTHHRGIDDAVNISRILQKMDGV